MLASDQRFVAVGVVGVEQRRVLRDRCQQGALGQGQVFGMFAKIGLSSRLYAVTTSAIGRFVEIES